MTKQHIKAKFGRPSKFQVTVVDRVTDSIYTSPAATESESIQTELQITTYFLSKRCSDVVVIRRRV